MSKITTFLTYDQSAEEAAKLYTSVFPRSRIVRTTYYGADAPMPEGTVMTVEIELDDQPYILLNGGSHFTFTDGVSLSVDCANQDEVDAYTAKLTAQGGSQGPCGWIKDRFGVSWQINPTILRTMIGDPDPAKAYRVMQAMLKMHKIDVAAIERAYRE